MKTKEISEENKKAVVYQLFLRAFTSEGTLSAASEMLEHIKETGVTHIYLCPVCESDSDDDTSKWSPRQLAAKTGNPKNPYRIKNYRKIDPEYGNDNDLTEFINKAHALGMKVILDIVYYHCGPKSVMISENSEFIVKNENGEPEMGEYNFPKLNYESSALREYLYSNMEYFVTKFDIDGYRADMGDYIPLDFWEEAVKRLSKIKPGLFMLNEGDKVEYTQKAFDCNYHFGWQITLAEIFKGDKSADALRIFYEKYQKNMEYNKGLRAIENHDLANNDYDNRIEKVVGNKGVDAMFVINFMSDGIPFIYNGNEMCDRERHSIFSNRDYGKFSINWRNSLTECGKNRKKLLNSLSVLRRSTPALYDGTLIWTDTSAPDSVISFIREKDKKVLVFVNTGKNVQKFDADSYGCTLPQLQNNSYFETDGSKLNITLLPYGYLVISDLK